MNMHQSESLFAEAATVASAAENSSETAATEITTDFSTEASTEPQLGEIEGRARAIVGGAAHFDALYGAEQPTCAQCDKPFAQRKGSGGKTQRFCKPECRAAWHADRQRSQRGPTCSEETQLAAGTVARSEENHPCAEFAVEEPGDLEVYWGIHSQIAIEVRPLKDGGVEIAQENASRDEEDLVHVAAGNAVRLARSILYAAGFKSIGIFTHVKGGCEDIQDGDEPRHFRPL